MNKYPESLYKEILECYNYEIRNKSSYGNIILTKNDYYNLNSYTYDIKQSKNH